MSLLSFLPLLICPFFPTFPFWQPLKVKWVFFSKSFPGACPVGRPNFFFWKIFPSPRSLSSWQVPIFFPSMQESVQLADPIFFLDAGVCPVGRKLGHKKRGGGKHLRVKAGCHLRLPTLVSSFLPPSEAFLFPSAPRRSDDLSS